MTLAEINDELGATRTNKKEFLELVFIAKSTEDRCPYLISRLVLS